MVTNTGLILTGCKYGEEQSGVRAGTAYLLDPLTGDPVFTMQNPELEEDTGYGAFSWAGDTRFVVTAFYQADGMTTQSGRAYVYDLSNGQLTQTINNPDPTVDDQFGYGVGMLGDVAIISARGDDSAGDGTGTVYLFNSLDGTLIRTIPCPNPTTQDNFGYSVAGVGTDKILVGAPNDDTGATDAGAAYLMDANTGGVIFRITNPNPAAGAAFGFQVRAQGDNLLIGSPGNKTAYLYDGTTGQMLQQFINPSPQSGDSAFGSCISSVGENVLIGNPFHATGADTLAGEAYLFSGATGTLLETYRNPTPATGERFGISVGDFNGKPVISADLDTVNGVTLVGSVYVYDAVPAAAADWNLFQ